MTCTCVVYNYVSMEAKCRLFETLQIGKKSDNLHCIFYGTFNFLSCIDRLTEHDDSITAFEMSVSLSLNVFHLFQHVYFNDNMLQEYI